MKYEYFAEKKNRNQKKFYGQVELQALSHPLGTNVLEDEGTDQKLPFVSHLEFQDKDWRYCCSLGKSLAILSIIFFAKLSADFE